VAIAIQINLSRITIFLIYLRWHNILNCRKPVSKLQESNPKLVRKSGRRNATILGEMPNNSTVVANIWKFFVLETNLKVIPVLARQKNSRR
jgi:hypothetical protein